MTISFTVQLFNMLFVYLNDGTTVVLEAVRFCHTPVSVYGRLSLSVKNLELICKSLTLTGLFQLY